VSVVDVVIQESHLRLLNAELVRPDKVERAAYILFGTSRIGSDPFSGEARVRLSIKEVLPVTQNEIRSADARHVSWSTERFAQLLADAERLGHNVGIAHSHPFGPADFSAQDDLNEAELIRMAQNRNGSDALLASLLITGDGTIRARLWSSPQRRDEALFVRTIGPRWHIFASQRRASTADAEAWSRQSLALGPAFNDLVRGLRVGVVGAGGTGSPILQQLARLGVGNIAIFDPDTVEVSNLNRVYGATRVDADQRRRKIEVARREIDRMGLGVNVVTFDEWIGSERCRDALKSLDIVFGCTDDHDGRGLLNRLAYYYLIPVIDVGLSLRVSERHGETRLDGDGRVTVLEPGSSCLLCRRVIDPAIASEEALRRSDPAEYERRKAEAYVRGEGNPAPAVISFTTSVATMALEEMIQRLQAFRGTDGAIANRVRRFGFAEDVRPGAKTEHCRICGNVRIHGAGDIEPFLGRVG